MEKSTLRTVKAINQNEIGIFGDYDVDGVPLLLSWEIIFQN